MPNVMIVRMHLSHEISPAGCSLLPLPAAAACWLLPAAVAKTRKKVLQIICVFLMKVDFAVLSPARERRDPYQVRSLRIKVVGAGPPPGHPPRGRSRGKSDSRARPHRHRQREPYAELREKQQAHYFGLIPLGPGPTWALGPLGLIRKSLSPLIRLLTVSYTHLTLPTILRV